MIRKSPIILFCVLLMTLMCNVANATTYNVGPGKTYTTLQQVQALLAPGDLVLVDGNTTYPGGVFLSIPGTAENPITIRGVRVNGNQPVISGGVYGINISNAHYNIIEGFVFTATTKAGIGHFADQVIIRDCVIRDNIKNGLIGYGQNSGSLTMEYCEIYHNGESTQSPNAHQIYMATDEAAFPNAVFRMQYCYIHDGNGGNNVKSRSGRNEIYYNWIEGATYHDLELIGPDPTDNPLVDDNTLREDADVVGNVLVVAAGGAACRAGSDGNGNGTFGRYHFVNNTFIMNGSGDGVRGSLGVGTIEMHNNVFYNKISAASTRIFYDLDMQWSNGRQVIGTNNWIQTGTSFVPAEFTGSVSGTNPGFVNIGTANFNLLSTSPLINASNSAPPTIAAYPAINPLFPPLIHPPLHTPQSSPAVARPGVGILDIGAYEYGSGPSCTYSLTPVSASAATAAGTGSIAVNTINGCAWATSINSPWITVTSATSGTGNGTVNYSYTLNSGGPRTGTLSIAGQTFTINQSGTACTYSLSSSGASYNSTGGSGNIAVTAIANCDWTAVSSAAWIVVPGTSANGTGSGSTSYKVTANNTNSSRSGTITIGGQIFTINQTGATGSCSSVTAGGEYDWANTSIPTQTGTFTAQFDAAVSLSTINAAVAFSSGQQFGFSGFGCIVLFDVDSKIKARNGATYPASTVSYTAGVSYHFRVAVNVATHTYSIYVTPAGGSEKTIGTNYAFRTEQASITQINNWAAVVNYTSAGNLQVCNFTLGTPCNYSISPASANVASTTTTGSISVTAGAGCAWTAVSNAAWITVTAGSSGTGNGTVNYSAAANTGAARTGTITAAGQTFTINQAGTACSYLISPSSANVAATSTTGSVSITAGAGCAWTAVSNAAWITVTAGLGGTGNGTVSYSAAANTGAARSGTITAAGQTFTINQAGTACSYSISPSSANVAATSTTGSVSVTAGAGCAWTAVSNAAWITVTAGSGGTGNGTVSYSASANTGVARTGTITAAGKTFTVSQATAVVAGGTQDLYIDEITPQISFIAGTGQVGTGAAVTVTTGGVGNSAYMKFSGLTSWDKSKRLHYTVAKDISAIAATAMLRISVDISSNASGTGIGIHFNDAWDQVVYSPDVNNTPGFQTFDIPISSIRSLMGNTVNDIYIEPSNGWTSGCVVKIDNVQLVAGPAARMGASNNISAINNIEAEKVKVFPNPSNNLITVVLSKSVKKSTGFKLVDVNGRVVVSEIIKPGKVTLTIQTKTFANGVYNLIIATPTGNAASRIVVNH